MKVWTKSLCGRCSDCITYDVCVAGARPVGPVAVAMTTGDS